MDSRIVLIALSLCVSSVHLAEAQSDPASPSQMEILGADQHPKLLIQQNQRLHLECKQYDGQRLEWRKNDDIIKTDGTGFVVFSQRSFDGRIVTSELIKNHVTLNDTGNYFCQHGRHPERNVVQRVIVVGFTVFHGNSTKNGDSAVMRCEIDEFQTFERLLWYRYDVLIEETTEGDKDTPKYITSNEHHSLTVNKVGQTDVGPYVCVFKYSGGNYTAEVQLYAVPRIRNNDVSSKNLVEGDPLVLECKTWGLPTVNVRWSRNGDELNATDGKVSFSNYTDEETSYVANDAKIRIEDMTFDDEADYMCFAYNDIGNTNHSITVRVKDKLAALWPFLGIVAEVAILCTIIFIYERKRAKQLEEEERREEADQLTNSNDHKGKDSEDLRQRKS